MTSSCNQAARGNPPVYLYTNESLEAIVKGIDVNGTDDIIAVCSSGDQAFALLEYASSVLAVDLNEDSTKYASYRLEAIKEGNISKFLEPRNFCNVFSAVAPIDMGKSKAYFMRGDRIEKIRKKAGKLQIMHKSIYEVNDLERFSKAYLSNALSYNRNRRDAEEAEPFLKRLVHGIKMPGIIYIVERCSDYSHDGIKKGFFNGKICPIRWPAVICVDERLTAEAKSYETSSHQWKPLVLRRETA